MEAKSLLEISQDHSLHFALPHSRYVYAFMYMRERGIRGVSID